MPQKQIDAIDLKILAKLQENARIANVDLAEAVGLSPSPCLRRVRELETEGVIREYVTLLDPAPVGLPVSVFVRISLEKQTEDALEAFEAAVGSWPEVMECYLMTGDSDYLLRVVAADIEAFKRFVLERLSALPAVASINSSFALKQVKYRTALPLPGVEN